MDTSLCTLHITQVYYSKCYGLKAEPIISSVHHQQVQRGYRDGIGGDTVPLTGQDTVGGDTVPLTGQDTVGGVIVPLTVQDTVGGDTVPLTGQDRW